MEELTGTVGAERARKLAERLAAAAGAYRRDRYGDTLRITTAILEQAPRSAAARELQGLACYRMGRWREAIRHLKAASELDGDEASRLPVLMDCHRALGRHRRVGELWEELRALSPPADVLIEGRLVLAEDLAEQGRLAEAVELLRSAGAERELRKPGARHVRQWYVLADLYERAGDLARARALFTRVADADPETADARQRLETLGQPPRSRPGGSRSGPDRPEVATGSRGDASRRAGAVTLGELARRAGRGR